MAFGGGLPYIKSYLNGVKIPGLLTLECFIAKVGGVVMSILGGLACGKVSSCLFLIKHQFLIYFCYIHRSDAHIVYFAIFT